MGPGNVLVFDAANPSKAPELFQNPSVLRYYFAGYGPKSTLWVSGQDYSGAYELSNCSYSSGRCGPVGLSGGTLYWPGAVQWDRSRKNWVLFDQECGGALAACSYPVHSYVLGTPTNYYDPAGHYVCDMVQAVINGKDKFVAGSDWDYCYGDISSDLWAYTAGGFPTNYVNYSTSSYHVPIGAAISTK